MKTPWKKCDITVTVLLTMKTLLTLILIRITFLQLVNKDYISSTQLSTRDNSREVNKLFFMWKKINLGFSLNSILICSF